MSLPKKFENCKTLTEQKAWALNKCSLTGEQRKNCSMKALTIMAQRPECLYRCCIPLITDEPLEREE